MHLSCGLAIYWSVHAAWKPIHVEPNRTRTRGCTCLTCATGITRSEELPEQEVDSAACRCQAGAVWVSAVAFWIVPNYARRQCCVDLLSNGMHESLYED